MVQVGRMTRCSGVRITSATVHNEDVFFIPPKEPQREAMMTTHVGDCLGRQQRRGDDPVPVDALQPDLLPCRH